MSSESPASETRDATTSTEKGEAQSLSRTAIPASRVNGFPHGASPTRPITSPHRVAGMSPLQSNKTRSSPVMRSPKFITSRERSASLGHSPGWGCRPTSAFLPQHPTPPFTSRSMAMSPMLMKSREEASLIPMLPSLNGPPAPSESRKAMEAAVASERARMKEMEKKEVDMTADELRSVLKRERSRMSRIAADLAALRSAAVQSQAEAEVIEEGRINSLMRRLDDLQQEKGRLIVDLEREEEMLTNTLQKKLNEVRREKAQLEKQIEREHLSNSNLKSRLTDMQRTRQDPVAEVPEEEEEEELEKEQE